MSAELEFEGLDEFRLKLSQVAEVFPKASEKHLTAAGNKLKKEAEQNTPIGHTDLSKRACKKHMAERWSKEIKGYTGQDLEYQLKNKSPAYHLIERGHVQVSHSGKIQGFTQGKFFFNKTVKEFQANGEIEKEMEKFMKDVKKRLD